MMLVPSVPSMVVDYAAAILTTTYLTFGSEREVVLCVETQFHFTEEKENVPAHFLLLPDMASLRAIFDAIRLG
jgi:hypothetical protein